MRAALVASPHLDDAVLSAGQLLAGRPDMIVVTVFAGQPRAKNVLTTYDRTCGFGSSREAVLARQAEDREALAILGANPVHLKFVDHQYGQPMDQEQIAQAIRAKVELYEPEFVAGPLGLGHPDHELVREAVLDAVLDSDTPLWLYEDTPTRITSPELVPRALQAVSARQAMVELGFVGDGSLEKKAAALWSYRTQLPLFPNYHTLLCPERFWKVSKAVTPEDLR
jgi:LmbE family N-acetylglucosaminyl deacetylase